MKFAENLRETYRQRIRQMKHNGDKFCVIFDEWTSLRLKRYMNVTLGVSGCQIINLGLVALYGSLTAKRILETVSSRLGEFDLSLQHDIISISTDGPKVMQLVGKLSPTHQQLCFAHAIQLAVIDVLYPKNKKVEEPVSNEDTQDGENETEPEVENEEEDDEEEEYDWGFETYLDETGEDVSAQHWSEFVADARKIIRSFRNATLKKEVLDKHCISDFKKTYELLLDTKTRWNSLFTMVERFCELRNCIRKALIDLDSEFKMEDWEFDRLEELVDALRPLKLTVEALCRRDSDLLQADTALNFALDKLDSANTPISLELAVALRRRIKERRTEASGVLNYLHTGNRTDETLDQNVFSTPPKKRIAEIITDFVARLNPEIPYAQGDAPVNQNDGDDVSIVETPGSEPPTKRKKIQSEDQHELNLALKKVKENSVKPLTVENHNLLASVKKEMTLFEANKSRGFHLELAYKYMKTIRPTSVESERVFSASGYFCNKIRSRLGNTTLDELSFLRTYFQLNED